MKTVLEVVKATTDYFTKHQVENPRLNAEHLVAHVLGIKRIGIYMEFDRQLHESELEPLRELLRKRSAGVPLQHLLGTVEFYGRVFATDARALIPRPETEQLVELILEELKPRVAKKERFLEQITGTDEPAAADSAGPGEPEPPGEQSPVSAPAEPVERENFSSHLESPATAQELPEAVRPVEPQPVESQPIPLRILDVGTGSGVIALTLAGELPDAEVTAVDISPDALSLARENAVKAGLGERVRFVESDLFSAFAKTGDSAPDSASDFEPGIPTGPFDLIVANLPYIAAEEIAGLSREVRHDPALALDGGVIGTEIIVRLLEQARGHLNPGGRIALEIGHDQSAVLAAELERQNYRDIRAVADYQGALRFLFAVYGPVYPASAGAGASAAAAGSAESKP